MKVLIVEDSVELAQSLSSFFDLDGHSTSSVSDLKTAEDIIAVSHFDIILLDIMLPDGSGEEILKMMRIKKNDTPVIIMTAKSEISNKINFLDIGADDYITKPFDFSELEAIQVPKVWTESFAMTEYEAKAKPMHKYIVVKSTISFLEFYIRMKLYSLPYLLYIKFVLGFQFL